MRRWRADCAFAALAMRARSEVSERVAGRRMILPDIAAYCVELSAWEIEWFDSEPMCIKCLVS
jgi:hypothetical protein